MLLSRAVCGQLLGRQGVSASASLRRLAGLATLELSAVWQGGRLGGTNITDRALAEISQIAALTLLNVASCGNFTAVGLEALLQLPRLETLDVSRCTQLDEAALAVVKLLSLRNCDVTDKTLLSVCNAVRLTSLNLRGCFKLTGAGAAHVARLPALNSLRLPEHADDTWPAFSGVGFSTAPRV